MNGSSRIGLRSVAIFEAAKGLVVLLAGFGLLALAHHDVQALAERFIVRMHVNPAHHYPRVFLEAAAHVTDARLRIVAGLALAYTIVRFVEAWGLWWERKWAEWFALFSGGLYLPIEIYEMARHPTWIKAAVIVVNALIVLFMIRVLHLSRKRFAEEKKRAAL